MLLSGKHSSAPGPGLSPGGVTLLSLQPGGVGWEQGERVLSRKKGSLSTGKGVSDREKGSLRRIKGS